MFLIKSPTPSATRAAGHRTDQSTNPVLAARNAMPITMRIAPKMKDAFRVTG